jgi:hypothetical protein
LRRLPSKRPERRQHALKPSFRAARAQIVAPELLDQLLVAVHDAIAASHAGFRRITPASAYARLRKHGRSSKSSSFGMTRLLGLKLKMVSAAGFEPATPCAQDRCSATELHAASWRPWGESNSRHAHRQCAALSLSYRAEEFGASGATRTPTGCALDAFPLPIGVQTLDWRTWEDSNLR